MRFIFIAILILSAVWFVFPYRADAGLVVKNPVITNPASSSNNVSGTVLTFSHTTSGRNRLLVVGITLRYNGCWSLASVTYADVAMNLSVDVSQGSVKSFIYTLSNPALGANNVVITCNTTGNYITAGAVSFSNVNTISPVQATAYNTGSSVAPSINVESKLNNLILSVMACENSDTGCGTIADTGPQTRIWAVNSAILAQKAAAATAGGKEGTVTLSWSTSNTPWAVTAIAIKPGGGAIIQRPLYIGLDSGLVGFWSFNALDMGTTSALDRSGNNNIGYLVNGPVKTIGKVGQALSFDGSNDFVDAGTGLDQNGEVTISAWIKSTKVTVGTGEIVSNCNSAGSACDYSFELNRTAGKLSVLRSAAAVSVTGSTVLSKNTWYHVATVISGSSGSWKVQIFLNGVSDGSATDVNNPSGSNETTAIGRAGAGNSLYFNGVIDEVRIYNRALSPEEVRRLYNMGQSKFNATQQSKITDGLVGYWSFNAPDMGTTSALDLSGNSNVGYLVNGPVKTAGKVGQALSFDGSNDFVDTGTGLDQNGEITISAWIKPSTVAVGTGEIVANCNSAVSACDYVLELNRTAGKLSVLRSAAAVSVTGSTVLSKNTWYHVATVISGSSGSWKVQIFLNGVSDGSATDVNNPSGSNETTAIGRAGAGNSLYFNGVIDEVRIYNRALSPEEVRRLYNMGR